MGIGPADFVEARRRLEAKPQKVGEKLTSLEEAASLVRDGDHVAIGGCFFSRTPLALLREVLRRGPKGLTLSRNLTCFEGEWFMTAGASDTADDVAQNTGFELVIPERLGATEPPRDEELEVLRSLDPERRLL